jgi:replicative DNA helicase
MNHLTTYLPDIHRLLPSSPDAEKAILSSLILAPREVAQMVHSEGITAAHFHVPAHSEVFANITAMISDGTPVDFVTLTKSLGAKLESIGGVGFVSELFTFLPTAANAAYYCELVKRDRLAREIIRVGTEYAARAYDSGEDIKTLAGAFHGDLSALLVEKRKRQSVRDCLMEIMQELATGSADGEVILTGIAEMDEKLHLYKGDLLIISAPTSCGKSALSNQILVTACLDRGARVAFYPLEMRQKQTIKRGLSMRAGINIKYVRQLLLNAKTEDAVRYADHAVARVQDAAVEMARAGLYIRDDLYTLDAILADIRAEHAKQAFSFVSIDYLQLIRCNGKFERRQLQIAEITQRLKMAANELDCVFIVPSQVNKQGGTREAEDAENDASALVKIHADESSKDVQPGRTEIWKQREGPRHVDLALKFNGLLTKFEPITQ